MLQLCLIKGQIQNRSHKIVAACKLLPQLTVIAKLCANYFLILLISETANQIRQSVEVSYLPRQKTVTTLVWLYTNVQYDTQFRQNSHNGLSVHLYGQTAMTKCMLRSSKVDNKLSWHLEGNAFFIETEISNDFN